MLGIGLRAWLLASPFGYLNSDEAHTSIQARELLRGHGWILVPGTPYGGNLEAWLDAPLAGLFGLSAMRNKIEVGMIWLAAGLVLARSVRHLGPGPMAVALGVVWLPSAALVQQSTLAYPGYAAGLLATCLMVAVARPLVDDPATRADPDESHGWRSPLKSRAAAVGALAGLAIWQHPLYGLVCATALAAVLWRQRRRIRPVLGAAGLGGALAAAPVIITNLRHDLVSLRHQAPEVLDYAGRVRAWVTDLYPRAVGAKWLGPRWVTGRIGEVLAVLVLAFLVIGCLAVLRWSPPWGKVAAGTLLAAPFAMTILGKTWYTLDGRYAVMLLPAAAVAIAHACALVRWSWFQGLGAPVMVAAWSFLAVVVPFGATLDDAGHPAGDIDELVAFLGARDVTAARADYWVAYRIVVATDERIVASPLAHIKFQRYEAEVRRADAAAGGAGVLVLDTPQVAAYLAATTPFDQAPWNGFLQFRGHHRFEVSHWTVFLPPEVPTDTPGRGPLLTTTPS